MVAQAGDALEMPNLGMKIVLGRTAGEMNGELLEYDVVGLQRGFVVPGASIRAARNGRR